MSTALGHTTALHLLPIEVWAGSDVVNDYTVYLHADAYTGLSSQEPGSYSGNGPFTSLGTEVTSPAFNKTVIAISKR